MKRSWLSRLLALCAIALVTATWVNEAPVEAAPIAASALNVGATVDIRCQIIAPSVAFGTYTPTSPTPLDATGNISVNCTDSIVNFIMHVRMNQGQNPGPGSTAANPIRRMSNGAAGRMRYGLYRDAARTQNWGDTLGSAVFPGFFASYPVLIPVYGRVPALQSVLAGSYQDAVLATLWF